MASRYDVIVVGLGGMGSAVVYHLSRRGQRVLGLEQYHIAHDLGSSHGVTRIIRLAYYEHPSYVLLLQRAYELWRELQRLAGEQLLYITGSIDAGPLGSEVFEGSRRSCELHSLPHEVITSDQLTRRFPAYRLPSETMAVLQPDGGFLVPERCIISHLRLAQNSGAEIQASEKVLEWEPLANGVKVKTDRSTYEADHLVVAAGSWISKLVNSLTGVTVPERQVLAWLQPHRPEYFAPKCFPVFNVTVEEGRYYGLPIFNVPGFKLGRYHHLSESVDPDQFDRKCHARDEELLRSFASRYFPDGAGLTMNLTTCMFTNTPDEHFILDLHPQYPQVAIASPCSGHGFKFCSVIGEIIADLVLDGNTRHDIAMHRMQRFTS